MSKHQKTRIIFILICCFLNINSWSQNLDRKSIITVEDHILNNQKDSATYYINLLDQKKVDPYINTLRVLAADETPSYNHYSLFSTRIFKNHSKSRDINFFKYIESIPAPSDNEQIDLDYVYTKWLYITRLRDIAQLEKANIENQKLADYINVYNTNDSNYTRAKLLLDIHAVVLSIIQRDEKGKNICIQNLELARKIGDKEIQALYLSYLCDIHSSIDRDINAFITAGEESIAIEKSLPVKTVLFESTIEKLIDGYLFIGNKNEEALKLLEELYNSTDSRAFSYSLYANFLRNIEASDPMNQKILAQFGVDNVIDFCKKIEAESVDVLDSNRLYFVLSQSSRLLQKRGFLNEAITYKSKCIELNQKIYSEDLASSLYDYESKQEIQRKELEIEHQKNKANLYIIIAFVLVFAFIILIFIVYKVLKQAKELKQKNIKIEEQRDAILKEGKEKALLLKEVHHRVKNNFQIVSSLLELQTKGIEDKKALSLANEGKNRVKSMALIHQKLYQNDSGLIDFNEYIHTLVKELSNMYASDKEVITNVNAENVQFDIDTAIPLGLIVNELITNAYKYAFDVTKENQLNISINKLNEEEYKLVVADNGKGIDDAMDLAKVKSLGLRLVKRLTKQLQGKFTINNVEGAMFEITFKDTNTRALLD
ncbi:sensor histidine kinase [uncultured Kordia sp.]|uniref:sensor histidine kinase n=1 Tax=uncultured Kordia sp. TaxID=507699 RepID=UPI00262D5597|nr:sensor histidine kinase [uncultured Kordia sp.]